MNTLRGATRDIWETTSQSRAIALRSLPETRTPELPRAGSTPEAAAPGFLALLPGSVATAMLPHLWPADFMPGEVLATGEAPLTEAVFLESGMAAVVVPAGDGVLVQAAALGRGDVIDPLSLMDPTRAPHRTVLQTRGSGWRIAAAGLRELADAHPALKRALIAHGEARLGHFARQATCSARHDLQQRLVRWIITADRLLDGEPIGLTHEAISRLLGVRRAGVTVALHCLEGEYAIRSHRNRIVVRDRDRLLSLGCACCRQSPTPAFGGKVVAPACPAVPA